MIAGWLLAAVAGCSRLPPPTDEDPGSTIDPVPSTEEPDSPSDTSATDAGDDPGLPAVSPIALARFVTFNVESGGSDPAVVAEVIAAIDGVSVWGLAEVEGAAVAAQLVGAAADPGQTLAYELGTTGWTDRLVIAWDDARFERVSSLELDDINVGGTARAPLVVVLRERSSDVTFTVMMNHLWRSDTEARHEQAALLNDWGRDQTRPFVALGDYNFDWSVENGPAAHDDGFDLLTRDGVFTWVQPAELVRTQCSAFYDSVLDFAFVGAGADGWPASSEILRSDAAYCDEALNGSDHRPVALSLGAPLDADP